MKNFVEKNTELSYSSMNSEHHSIPGIIFGYICKLIIITVSVYGTMSLFCSSIGVCFDPMPFIPTFVFWCVLGCASSVFVCCRTRVLLIWLLTFCVGFLVYIKLGGGILQTFGDPIVTVFDQAVSHLSQNGFPKLSSLYTGSAGGIYGLDKGLKIVCAFITFITSFCLILQTLLPFYYGVMSLVLVFACTYNVFENNLAFMIIVSSLISTGVLKACNNRFKGLVGLPFDKIRRNILYYSKSGLCGLLILILCLSLSFTPSVSTTEDFVKLPAIDTLMSQIRNTTYDILNGGDLSSLFPSDSAVDTSRCGKDIGFSSRVTTGEVLGKAYSDSASPLYLRTHTYESYSDGHWSADSDMDIFAEDITELFVFCEVLDRVGQLYKPSILSSTISPMLYSEREVGISLKTPGYERLPIPSTFDRSGLGLYEFGANTPYSKALWEYGNGDISVRRKGILHEYSAHAFTVSAKAQTSFILGRSVDEFIKLLDIMEDYFDGQISEIELLDMCIERCSDTGKAALSQSHISRMPQSLKELTPEKKAHYAHTARNARLYSSYTKENYSKKAVSTAEFISLSDKIKKESLDMTGMYEISVASGISRYLSENCTYTTEPISSGKYNDPVSEFLFGSQQGYCEHFATSAAMLFRACGVPARYAEGYFLQELSSDGDRGYPYSADITDEASHAWVEYYIDGVGWVTYEATRVFADNNIIYTPITRPETEPPVTQPPHTEPELTTDIMTSAGSETAEPEEATTAPDGADTDTAVLPDTTSGTVISGNTNMMPLIYSVIVVLAVSSVIFAILMHRKKSVEKKNARISAARALECEDVGEFICRYMHCLLELLEAVGLYPEFSEIPESFAARCGALEPHVTLAVAVYQKQRFYGKVTPEDGKAFAEAYDAIEKYVTTNAKKRRLLILRIKGRI